MDLNKTVEEIVASWPQSVKDFAVQSVQRDSRFDRRDWAEPGRRAGDPRPVDILIKLEIMRWER